MTPIANGVSINATGTSLDVPNTLVARDSLGNFAASRINATDFAATGATSSSVVSEAAVTGDAFDRFYMTAAGTMNWGNGSSPTDVNMFRSAPNTLLVDLGNMIITGYVSAGIAVAPTNTFLGAVSGATFYATNISNAASLLALSARLTTDTSPKFTIDYNGALLWGNGSSPQVTRLQRTAQGTLTFDNGTTTGEGSFIVTGNEFVSHYELVGGVVAPLNTNVGDFTATRMMIGGTDFLLSTTDGAFAKINGNVQGVNTGTVIGFNSTISVSPSASASASFVGNHFATAIASDSAVTGQVIGGRSLAEMGGAGSVTTAVGLFAGTAVISNRPGNNGLLTLGVTAGGTGYVVGNVLSVTGGTGGTVTVLTVSSGAVTSVGLLTPGTGYTAGAGKTTAPVTGTGSGFTLNLIATSATQYGSMVGLQAQAYSSAGTAATPAIVGPLVGIQVLDSSLGSGPSANLGTQVGILVQPQTTGTVINIGLEVLGFTGAATSNTQILLQKITAAGGGVNNIALDIVSPVSAALINVGLRITAPSGAVTNRAVQFVTDTTTASNGILFGSGLDTAGKQANLYRSGASVLRTDGEMQALHFLCVSGTPSIGTFGTGASNPVGTASFMSITGTDQAFSISILTGNTPAGAGAVIFTITFAATFSSTPTIIFVSPASNTATDLAAAAIPHATTGTASGFSFFAGTNGLPASQPFTWNFMVGR